MTRLTQCLEPFVSVRANPLTDGLAREGLRRAAAGLRAAYADGTDLAARSDMAVCSLLGGIALANAKLGAVHRRHRGRAARHRLRRAAGPGHAGQRTGAAVDAAATLYQVLAG